MKTNRLLLVIISLSIMNSGLFASTIINGGNISGVWSASGSPYLVYGNVNIPNGSTLRIDAGVQIIFQGYYSMNVEGKILAIGENTSTILFTINDTTGAANRTIQNGKWAGIIFAYDENKEDTSKFIYCTLSYSRRAIHISSTTNVEIIKSTLINNYGENWGAAVYINNFGGDAYVKIKECLITKNVSDVGSGIYCYSGVKINIVDNEISYNRAIQGAGAINYSYNQGGLITGNIIKFNKCINGAGGINCYGKNIEISHNTIHDNTGGNAGGICFQTTFNSYCRNNILINNSALFGGGILCNESDFEISNNVICNNTASSGSGGISIDRSNIILTGNTICNNKGTLGGGLRFSESEALIYNTILWGNSATYGSQIYISDNFSSPSIYYSDIQNGTGGFGYSSGTSFHGEYLNNIQLTPQFTSPAIAVGVNVNAMSANWSIKNTSPCINAGTPDLTDLDIPDYDLNGIKRVRNGRIDIGAYETYIDKIYVNGTISSNTEWIADNVEVTGDIYIPDNITLKIPAGTRVTFTGHFKINVHGTLLANGTKKENIIFEVNDTTGFSQRETIAGSWDGINFNNGPDTGGANGLMNDNDSSVLKYCILQFAKSNGYGGAILIDHFSRIRLENCIIQYCVSFGEYNGLGGGIYCVYGNPFLRNSNLEGNYCQRGGGGIFMQSSNMIIENCTINNNKSGQVGSGIYMDFSSPVINYSIISNNSSRSSDFTGYDMGGGIFCKNSNPLFSNCKILNNQHNFYGAAALLWEGHPVFINCLFANNYGISNGGIIYLNFSDGAVFINNTIVSNSATAMMFNASVAKIYNTIIWGNNNQLIIYGPAQTKIDIYNSIIQDGVPESYTTDGPIKNYVNVSEINPQFINPSNVVGYDEESIVKDYTVNSFSPSINKGTSNIQDHIMAVNDLNGNPRIVADSVDIGAFEHQGGKIIILEEPTGGSFCEGNVMRLTVSVNDTAKVQWQKDGVEIPGANAYEFVIDSVSSIDQGNYRCQVSNAYGITTSEQTTVFVTKLPEIQIIDIDPWIIPQVETTMKVLADGTNIKYQWKKDGNGILNGNFPEYHFIPDGVSSEGVYTCEISNICLSVESDPVHVFLAPQICMVTVSTLTGNNLVVWEKNTTAPIAEYKIYRESKYAGIYDNIATLPYKNLSIFVDTAADPTIQAYLYKITAVDTSGFETDMDLCKTHKTIHLLVTINPETHSTQLDWDRYVGFEYGTYDVFRSETKINFLSIHEMSSSTSTWTDPDPGTSTKYYRIAALRPEPCYPTDNTTQKAESGPYSQSMSNLEDNRFLTGISASPGKSEILNINPNPFKESTILFFNNPENIPYVLYIIDLAGKVKRVVDNIMGSEYVLQKGDLKQGFYFIELRGPDIYRGKIIVE